MNITLQGRVPGPYLFHTRLDNINNTICFGI